MLQLECACRSPASQDCQIKSLIGCIPFVGMLEKLLQMMHGPLLETESCSCAVLTPTCCMTCSLEKQ